MARGSSCRAAQAGSLRGRFYLILYNRSIVPKFELASFENASNDCMTVDKS